MADARSETSAADGNNIILSDPSLHPKKPVESREYLQPGSKRAGQWQASSGIKLMPR
jgi:hypothetical protein